MLWRHPGCVDLDQITIVHYCAKVRFNLLDSFDIYMMVLIMLVWLFVIKFQGLQVLEIHWRRGAYGPRKYKDVGKKWETITQ